MRCDTPVYHVGAESKQMKSKQTSNRELPYRRPSYHENIFHFFIFVGSDLGTGTEIP